MASAASDVTPLHAPRSHPFVGTRSRWRQRRCARTRTTRRPRSAQASLSWAEFISAIGTPKLRASCVNFCSRSCSDSSWSGAARCSATTSAIAAITSSAPSLARQTKGRRRSAGLRSGGVRGARRAMAASGARRREVSIYGAVAVATGAPAIKFARSRRAQNFADDGRAWWRPRRARRAQGPGGGGPLRRPRPRPQRRAAASSKFVG